MAINNVKDTQSLLADIEDWMDNPKFQPQEQNKWFFGEGLSYYTQLCEVVKVLTYLQENFKVVIANEKSLEQAYNEVKDLPSQFTVLSNKVDDLTNTVSNLPTRVQELETKVTKLISDVSSQLTRIETLEGNVGTNTNDISTIKTDIANIKSKDNQQDGKITTLEGNVDTNTQSISDINNEVDKIKAKDSEQDVKIDELNTLIDSHVYGFKREIANSNYLTRITYIDEAFGKIPVTVNLENQTQDLGSWGEFINKVARPVMVNYGGVVDYELDHNDTTKKLDGSPSDIDNLNYEGNAMVEFRNYRYVSRKTVDGFQYVRFANYKVDDTFEDNAFINENGAHGLAFYFSMFDGGLVGDKMRSIAGAEILRSKNASQEMTLAKSNGKGWNTGTWSQLNYIWDLLTLLGKTDGLQETFGRGICDLDYNNGVNPFGWLVGQTKNKGCFFGQSGGDNPVRTLWIEDLWGRAYDRYAGMINDNGTFKIKLVPPYPTPSNEASAYSDFIDTGLITPPAGYIKEANCNEYGFLPQVTGANASTYFCDYFYKNDDGVKYVLVGGAWNLGSNGGRCVYVSLASSNASPDVDSRLSYTS